MRFLPSIVAAALACCGAAASAADALFVDGNTVRQVQKTLADRGYRTGGADGRMGPQTQAALKRFQKAENLEPTGQLNRQTLVALGIQKPEPAAHAPRYDAEIIRRVQQTLNDRGYQAGMANGVLTERTHAALRQFQRSENLEDTGRLNARTLAALGIEEGNASAGDSAPAPLHFSSATVREVQRRLNERGYALGTPDGVMGPATRAALMEFQRKEKLPVTGRATRETLAALGMEPAVAARR